MKTCGKCNNPDCIQCFPTRMSTIIKADSEIIREIYSEIPTKEDPVNPSHYDGDACMIAIEECTKDLKGPEGYLTGVIIKYLWRWNRKNGVEDLKKVRWYLNRLITRLERSSTNER